MTQWQRSQLDSFGLNTGSTAVPSLRQAHPVRSDRPIQSSYLSLIANWSSTQSLQHTESSFRCWKMSFHELFHRVTTSVTHLWSFHKINGVEQKALLLYGEIEDETSTKQSQAWSTTWALYLAYKNPARLCSGSLQFTSEPSLCVPIRRVAVWVPHSYDEVA